MPRPSSHQCSFVGRELCFGDFVPEEVDQVMAWVLGQLGRGLWSSIRSWTGGMLSIIPRSW